MKELRKIAFVLEEFALQTPAQQLVDRFLLGYPRDGEFHRVERESVCVHLAGTAAMNPELERRSKDHGLVWDDSLESAVRSADGVAIVGRAEGAAPSDALIESALKACAADSCCFVHGTLGAGFDSATAHVDLARSRSIRLLAGTPIAVTWRLPEVDVARGAALRDALIVVQGTFPGAELDGLEGILPVIERRRNGEAGVKSVRLLTGRDLWAAGDAGQWSWELLAAALSRSDSPQGDSVTDGRTQNLVGLGLVPKLAREPRAWLIEHRDGLRTAVFVLNGVIADYDFAVRLEDGTVLSAQLYRPPKPQQHEFSRLAGVVEDFFQTGALPWPMSRSVLASGLIGAFRNALNRPGERAETPRL